MEVGKVYIVTTCDEWNISKAQMPYWVGTSFAKMCLAIRKAVAGGIMGYVIHCDYDYYEQSECLWYDLMHVRSHEERIRILGNVVGGVVEVYENNELT